MLLPKPKKIKLKPKEMAKLRASVFERDGYKCVICRMAPATDLHHQPYGASKSDEYTKTVALCHTCHMDLHSHPKLGRVYYDIVKKYLEGVKNGKSRRENE